MSEPAGSSQALLLLSLWRNWTWKSDTAWPSLARLPLTGIQSPVWFQFSIINSPAEIYNLPGPGLDLLITSNFSLFISGLNLKYISRIGHALSNWCFYFFPFVFSLRIVFPGLIVPFSSRFLTIFLDNFNVSLLRKKQIEKVECAIFIEQTLQAPLLSGHVQAGIFKKYFYNKYFNILSPAAIPSILTLTWLKFAQVRSSPCLRKIPSDWRILKLLLTDWRAWRLLDGENTLSSELSGNIIRVSPELMDSK